MKQESRVPREIESNFRFSLETTTIITAIISDTPQEIRMYFGWCLSDAVHCAFRLNELVHPKDTLNLHLKSHSVIAGIIITSENNSEYKENE